MCPLPLARAPATEPRPQLPAARAAPSPPVLSAGPQVAPVTRVALPPPAVQAPQPLVSVAQSTQATQVSSLIDLRVVAPPSLVRVDTPPPLHARVVPALVLEPASDQQHLAPHRKKARVAVRIVDGNAQSQCSATAYGGYGAVSSATRERRNPTRSITSGGRAGEHRVKQHRSHNPIACIATRSRRALPKFKRILGCCTATSQENSCVALAQFATKQNNLYVALAPLATSQKNSCLAVAPFAT